MAKKPKTTKSKNKKKNEHTLQIILNHSGGREIKITGTWSGLEINSIKKSINKTPNQKIEVTEK